ncbi:MAG TPA: permease-like cell division protein FtsX [Gemmatimonadaceae bacterium]|nr:permease-like cell division protein FtsX [Gemmatimonadaceae bacterium]
MLAFREAVIAFRRAPLLSTLSVTTIAFSLFAFGLFGLVALNIRQTLGALEERVEIRAFIVDGTPVEAVAAAVGDIAAFPEVQRPVQIISQDQALGRARRELGEFRDVFEAGILPASIEVRLKTGFRDPATVRAVAARVASYAFVDDVRYGQEWVEKLYRIRTVATVVGSVLGLAFAAVAVIIIGATIRTAVLMRSREISIMRLVGATDGFIRRPFLIEGFLKGVLGGALALALVWTATTLIDRYLIRAAFFDARLALLGLLFGALIGLAGSAVSVGRHLRSV